MQFLRLISTVLAAATIASAAPGQEAEVESTKSMRARLAAALTRYGRGVLGTDPLSVEGLRAGTEFLREATVLDPDQLAAWRLLLGAALLVEREDLVEIALPAIVRLDPGDTVARTQRLWQAMDAAATLEQKSAMADQLLTPDAIDVIGSDVAARLMLRMALLHRRAGDVDAFMQRLNGALELDPTFLEAMAIRTGLLQHLEQEDPVAWTEVLQNLHLANLTDGGAAAELGLHLLHHGAYEAAARMLSMARGLESVAGHDVGTALDADLISALWASGDDEAAEALLEERTLALDQIFQQLAAAQSEHRLNTLEVARLKGPLPPKLSAMQVMLAADHDEAADLRDALATAVEATDDLDRLRAAENMPPEVRVANFERLLMLLLVFDASAGTIEDVESRIQDLRPLDEDMQAVVDAALGRMPTAEERLAVLRAQAPRSTTAALVLARRLDVEGYRREAATILLDAWRRSPGTLLGMLAGHRLSNLLGTPLPMEATAAAMAEIVDRVPRVVDRFPFEPSLAVVVHAEAKADRVGVYEPVIIDVTIANQTTSPLAIGPNGPVKDLVLIEPTVDQPYESADAGMPILLDIAKRLQLPPHGEMRFSIDLRTTWVGEILNERPLNGAQIDTEVYFNPRVATARQSGLPTPRPGPLGGVYATQSIRVDGQRVTDAWIETSIADLRDASMSNDAVTMALLGSVLRDQDAAEGATSVTVDQASLMVATMVEAWPKLDPVSQRWLAAVMPRTDRLQALWDLIDASQDSLIQQITLVRIATLYDDPSSALEEPLVSAGLRSNDVAVRRLAEWIEATLQLRAEQLYGGGTAPGG